MNLKKQEVMSHTDCDINKAKDLIARSANVFEDNGMYKDAEQLMKMVYKLEAFQHKYDGR